jgi:hypothetical protein
LKRDQQIKERQMQPTQGKDFMLDGMLTVALELAKGSWKMDFEDIGARTLGDRPRFP